MIRRNSQSVKRGMTAVEVVASTLLASMLMVAMIGVLRGLKSQEAALEIRLPIPSWQAGLDNVLQRDLANSRTYAVTPTALVLQGFGGKDPQSGRANWQPTTIVYEVVEDGERNWLVRHERESHELVLAEVKSIRVGAVSSEIIPQAATLLRDTPIAGGLVVQFWGSDNREGPIYGFHFRRP